MIEYKGSVRAVSVELKFAGKEQWQRLLALSDTCRELANCAWQTWLVEHVKRGTAAKIREFVKLKKAWHETKEGAAPKFDGGFPVDAALSKLIYRACVAQCPYLTTASVSAFLRIFTKRIEKRKASNGSLPGWWAILLCRESLPSSVRSQPIPLRAAETSLAVDGVKWTLTVKASRKGFGHVITDVFPLIAGGYQTRSVTAILDRIVSGEHKLCGSSLVYSRSKNKWFAQIGYQRKEKVALVGTETAFLYAGRKVPWKVRIAGRSMTRGGRGDYVAAIRQNLLTQRWSRQNNYRFAGSANKGHGRERAMEPVEKLSTRWKDFVKTCNQQLAKSIVDECASRNVGTLIYFQPRSTNRFLQTAGKIPGRQDSTGWDWYQVRTLLESKCEECGITLVVRAGRSDEKAGDRSRAKAGKGLQSKNRKAG